MTLYVNIETGEVATEERDGFVEVLNPQPIRPVGHRSKDELRKARDEGELVPIFLPQSAIAPLVSGGMPPPYKVQGEYVGVVMGQLAPASIF